MWRVTLVTVLALGISFGQNPNPGAPFEGRQFTAEQAAAAEARIATDPDNALDRLYLLGYYWLQEQTGGATEINRAARLNQILWLIVHHPELEVFTAREGTLPDGAADEQMKQAWGQALTTHSADPRVLSNAAWFYRISDERQSLDLLHKALALNPADRQIANRLGNEYALILSDASASFALRQSVRAELRQSTQAVVLYSTGSALSGLIAGAKATGPDATELQAFAGSLMDRAKALDPAVTPQRIRVGGNVQAANLVKKVAPVYPLQAKEERIQGVVRFAVVIAKDGTVENVQLVSGHPLLVAASVDAVKQWVYKPTLLNGLPVEVLTQVDVNFSLQP